MFSGVFMGFGVILIFRSKGGGKNFRTRREGGGAKNFRRVVRGGERKILDRQYFLNPLEK